MGNICRSPAAEGVLRRLADERGVASHIEIDSAGTTAYHAGEPADSRMQAAAAERGYELTSISRGVVMGDFERFDLIIAMDRDNLRDLEGSAPPDARARIELLSAYLPVGTVEDVPDPYYGGSHGFEIVLDMLEQASPLLLDDLLS